MAGQTVSGAEAFGTLPDGRTVTRHRIAAGEIEAAILTYGATVQDLRVGGRRVVIGADRIEPYLGDLRYAGAIVGRFANRIGKARFDLDGRTFHTDPNFLGRHTLHGGAEGAGSRLWTLEEAEADRLRLSLLLPDGDMGFPGEMTVTAEYSLLPPGTLRLVIEARTTRPGPCSFAHHGYFVLDDSGTITGHDLHIDAGAYLPVDAELIPTGEIAPVAGTPFDFRAARRIGEAGYDHNFCLAGHTGPLREVARLASAESGLSMTVATTEPGLQLYDGAHLAGLRGHDGQVFAARPALALETQAWPDSPNRPAFPDCRLDPGATYRAETRYIFAGV